jgi:hypothetical protein
MVADIDGGRRLSLKNTEAASFGELVAHDDAERVLQRLACVAGEEGEGVVRRRRRGGDAPVKFISTMSCLGGDC